MILLINNTEAAGLTRYIQQLELCYRDITQCISKVTYKAIKRCFIYCSSRKRHD